MVDDKFITVDFWDTASQEDYKKLRPLAYPQTDVFILAFSLVDPKSFVNVEKDWIPEIKEYCPNTPYILVGMKSYLRDESEKKGMDVVSSMEGEEMKEKIGANYYVECDSLNKYHLNEVVESAVRCASESKPKQVKSKKKKRKDKDSNSKKVITDAPVEKKKQPEPKEPTELEKAQSLIKSLRDELNAKTRELDQVSTEKIKLKSEVEQKTRDFKKVSTEKIKLQSELNAKTRELDQVSTEKIKLQSEIEQKTRDFKKVSTEKRDLQSEVEQKVSEIKKISKQKQNLESQLEKVEKEKEDLEQKLKKESSNTTNNEAQSNKSKTIEIIDSISEYEQIEDIGVGSSGRVAKVAKKEIFAMKIMSNTSSGVEGFRNFIKEYELMNILDHPNILKAFSLFLSDEKNPPAIVLEFCPQNLFVAITKNSLSNVEIACAIYQIAEGMRYIHFNKIIHRDLKPSNILIASDGTIKISDFGISKMMTNEQLSMTVGIGTNKFMAPEIIAEEDDYNEKVDVYSFGVLVFFALSGGQLPKIKTPQILQGKKAEIPQSFTDFAKRIINDCWNFNANDRPSFIQICNQMKKELNSLFQFTAQEKNEINLFLKNHQKRIPKY